MRFPDFLIIGAMKCGTTSLYFDLRSNPAIYLPEDKEPHNLAEESVLEEEGRTSYARLFRSARADQICGEASTGYSKLPDIQGVPRRAHTLLGPRTRIIYLVREPLARAISHHYHEVTAGTMGPDINQAVHDHPRLIQYSRYAMQLRAWLEYFNDQQIHVFRFEDYVQDREGGVARISKILGAPVDTRGVQHHKVHNRGEDALVPAGTLWRFSRTGAYRTLIRPWVSRSVRTRVRRAFMTPAPPRPELPSRKTIEYIIDRVQSDQEDLQQLLGVMEPLWDLEAVRRKYLEAR